MHREYLDLCLAYNKSYMRIFLFLFLLPELKMLNPYDFSRSSFECLASNLMYTIPNSCSTSKLTSPYVSPTISIAVPAKTWDIFYYSFYFNPYIQQFNIIVGITLTNASKSDYSLLPQLLSPSSSLPVQPLQSCARFHFCVAKLCALQTS